MKYEGGESDSRLSIMMVMSKTQNKLHCQPQTCTFIIIHLHLHVFACASEFRAGRIWGHGLLTFSDGSNSSEGYFQVDYFIGVVVMFLVLVVARRALYS